MPRPSLRSRSLRKVKLRIPGGASVVHYLRRNPGKARCATCNSVLHGVASKRPTQQKNLPKAQKTVSRAYGGNLCNGCTKEAMKAKARDTKL